MIKVYFKDCVVPSYLVSIEGDLTPRVTFNGVVVVWKWKGIYYAKRLSGESVIKISDGINCKIQLNKLIR